MTGTTMAATIALPALLKATEIQGNIVKIGKHFNSEKMLKLFAETAVQTLLHAHQFGDVTLCQRLYEAVNGGAGVVRGESLKAWFSKVAPITARKGVWRLKEDRKPEDWKLEDAISQPFWEFMGPEIVKPISADNLLQVVKGLARRAETAREKGTFKGDYEKTMGVVNNIISFSEAQFQKLSLKDRGKEDLTSDVILEAASAS